MKKLLLLFVAFVLVLSFIACSKDGDGNTDSSNDVPDDTSQSGAPDNSDDTETSDSDSSDDAESSSTDTSSGTDTPDNPTNKDIPKIDYSVDIGNAIKINDVFNSSNNTFGNEGSALSYLNIIDIDVARMASGGKTQIISEGGLERVYRIFGTSVNGQIRIRAEGQDVYIILDNLNLTYNGDEAPIYAEKCKSVTIILAENSVNTITDSTSNTKKGAIYVKSSNLTIDGKGTLNVNANYKSGIFNTKNLTINGGTYNIKSNYHGIYGEQKLTLNGGTFNIESSRSGLKSGDYDELLPEQAVEGSIEINGGYIKTNSKTNGISSYGNVVINNGWIELKAGSDGIDSTKNVAINGGTLIAESTANGIKSVTNVEIKGISNVKIETKGDGITASELDISTSGVVYIKAVPTYTGDNVNGIYVRENGTYYRVNTLDFPNREWYSVVGSTKGIKVTGKVKISSGTIGIDSGEDAVNVSGDFEMVGGKLYIKTNEDAVSAANITVSDNSMLYILKCYKGLKSGNGTLTEENAGNVTVNNGTVVCVPVTDSLKSANITVNGSKLYLFDVVDFRGGVFKINGGEIFMVSTKKNATTPSESAVKYISESITDKTLYTSDKFVKISGEGVDIVVKLPKNYKEDVTVFVCSALMTESSYNVEVGTYIGSIAHPLVYSDGEFTSEALQQINSK